ncbi:hypothetical protein GCM10018785_06320 [Streptomyces longispororuber]|uniref:Uncharacterized protein n=1 Tax=Streptomyces longispororuber TaxID=68230 RepID=A0A918Z6Y0_9ACTN|nr:hypothetical protein GCM10018785_06320 [Streptomyces longispororuber]
MRLSETLDTYGYLDWVNAPASFEELYGMPAPPGLPGAALVPGAERRGGADMAECCRRLRHVHVVCTGVGEALGRRSSQGFPAEAPSVPSVLRG